ncbi:hypothetical protein L9F63_021881, partial [Diploptera punctata]
FNSPTFPPETASGVLKGCLEGGREACSSPTFRQRLRLASSRVVLRVVVRLVVPRRFARDCVWLSSRVVLRVVVRLVVPRRFARDCVWRPQGLDCGCLEGGREACSSPTFRQRLRLASSRVVLRVV